MKEILSNKTKKPYHQFYKIEFKEKYEHSNSYCLLKKLFDSHKNTPLHLTDLNDIYDNFISNSLSFFVFMCLKNGDKMFVNITFCGGKNWAKNLIWLRLDYNKKIKPSFIEKIIIFN